MLVWGWVGSFSVSPDSLTLPARFDGENARIAHRCCGHTDFTEPLPKGVEQEWEVNGSLSLLRRQAALIPVAFKQVLLQLHPSGLQPQLFRDTFHVVTLQPQALVSHGKDAHVVLHLKAKSALQLPLVLHRIAITDLADQGMHQKLSHLADCRGCILSGRGMSCNADQL